MSPSGRFQSRLFSFFSQQSLRLKDKTGQAWRQVKLATVWSTQIALYPIYALFQTGRLLGRQMGQATRQFPRLRIVQQQILNPSDPNLATPFALFVDAPIHNLLADQGENLTVRGIASLLTNRGLVLVTAENETLDVLTGEQQIQLQRQIVWEMANYWRYRKIQLPLEERTHLQGWTNTFLPLPKERANLLPPIRTFRHLMGWIQLSPVAIAVNLFQESRLAALPFVPDVSPDISLEELPLRSAQVLGSRINQAVQDLLKERSPDLLLLAWVKRQANGLAVLSKSLGGFLQISSIVLYDPLSKSEPEDFSAVLHPLSPPLPQTPWLKIEDLLGGKFLGLSGSSEVVKRREEAVQQTGAREAIAGGQLEEIAYVDPTTELMRRSPSPSALSQPANTEGGITSTLLEAEVTEISYEQHPLEQLLKWLDQGMLWLEQKLGQVWRWLHRSGI